MTPLLSIEKVSHRYGSRVALQDVSFTVQEAQWLGLLGPNGSGKSTLFRLLSTLVPAQQGRVCFAGHDLRDDPNTLRHQLGVVFQSPALDKKLTVAENLRHHGHLYGWRGGVLTERIATMLAKLGLTERANDFVEKLSGGLQRRVELAKGLLPQPKLLLLDEPSAGLDPAARRDFWNYLRQEQKESGLTIIMTTHLLDEAEACQQLVVLDAGRVVADSTPAALKATVPGTVITIHSPNLPDLQEKIQTQFSGPVRLIDQALRIEWNPQQTVATSAADLLRRLTEAFPQEITAITLAQPTLEDAFIQLTGHGLQSAETDSV
jgi:ABC-2 type transport system ATP-binding protein